MFFAAQEAILARLNDVSVADVIDGSARSPVGAGDGAT